VYHTERRLSSRAITETIKLTSTSAQYAFRRYVRTGLLLPVRIVAAHVCKECREHQRVRMTQNRKPLNAT
jgi:hypothetical protein